MSTSDHSREIAVLVKKLRAEFGPAPAIHVAPVPPASTASPSPLAGTSTATSPTSATDAALAPTAPAPLPLGPPHNLLEPDQPIINEFVRSMLIWEATTAKAATALKRMAETCVDLNEFRVCLPAEMVKILGERYPRVEERCLRLRAALNQIFIREHALTMQPLAALGKREAREYLDAIEGVPRFVTARVCLLCLGVHAAPVDGRILKRLLEAEIVEPGATPESAAGILERSVKAGDLAELYWLLQSAVDQAPANYSDSPPASATERFRPRKDVKPAPNNSHRPEPGKKGPPPPGKGTSKDPSKRKSAAE